MIDTFCRFGEKTFLKNKITQTIKHAFENILITSIRKPNLIETDDGEKFVSKLFTDLLKKQS